MTDESGNSVNRALALRLALGGSVLWLLVGAGLIPRINDWTGAITAWLALLTTVTVGTLVLSLRELMRARTRPAGVAGLLAALVLGAASALLWVMAGPLP